MSYINKPKLIIESTTSTDIKTQPDVSHKSKIPSSTKLILNKDACEEEKDLRKDLKNLNEGIKIKRSECAVIKYKIIYEYFDPDKRHATFKDLLNALMLYYKDINREQKQELHLESFLDMFEMDTMKRKNFKKQHVFEALCKILLMYDYDNGGLGKDKQFYRSLEAFIENPNSSIITRDQIIHTEINVSSEGGVVDIFFKTKHNNSKKSTSDWACDFKDDANAQKKTIDGQEYILIQNKYFSKEKSDIKNYDVTRIRTKASDLYKEKIRPKIVLMVNNKQALSDKLTRSRDTNKGLIDAIYGVYEIDKWFNLLLYDLLNSSDIDDFLEKRGTKSTKQAELAPRFHQMYFTDSTIEYRRKEGYKKFIWGAVPRSGKSYMIGDLISKRKEGPFNDVILILGAKTETESQFIEMFCKFSNYNDYGIIKTSAGKIVSTEDYVKISKNLNKLMDKNIYIFSQEWFKTKLDESAAPVFDLKHKTTDFEKLFKSGNVVDVYFDEVHKGGTTDKSENILNAINRAGVKIDIFVMVTATFAKPNIKYQTNFIDKKEPKIIEWSYEDQQVMKNIKNETKMDMMINSRVGIEREVIRNTFEYYKSIYHNEYLDIISKEYARHPELVLVQPFDKIEKFGDDKFEIDKIFKSNLNCEACYENQTKRELRDPSRIFFDYGRIQNLLRLIAGDHNPKNSVYGYLKSIGAPDYSKKHSELWFLPDDDLYITPDTCRETGKCKQIKSEKSSNENKNDNKQSLPNIEALTRGLALALMENEHFKKYYNVLIVHNTYVKFKNLGDVVSYEEIFKDTGISTTADSKNLSETIKRTETNTFREGKNLIILTGAKLRLGISLPCVDIGFNFDNIKSVDVNYQTMFRVLTERYNQPKPFGYYVDFNKERFINFLYQYSNTYSSAKNISNIKANLSTLQGLLYLFNINGIGLGKLNENQELKLYTSLIEELKLNEAGYKTYYSDFSTMTELIKKSLINVRSSDLQKFKKLLDSGKKITKPPKLKITLVEGTTVNPAVVQNDSGNDDMEEIGVEEEPEVENDSNTVIVNIISDMLPRIITLIALFSNEDNYNCDNLSDCLGNCLRKIQEFGTGCNCSIVSSSDVLSCYLNSPFYADKLGLLLETIDGLLNDLDNKQLHDSANFIFNNIREMGKENLPLIYSMSPEDIQDKIEKYLPVREEKKHKNGEVFTPIHLIEEMLEKLPESVWTNPNLKWLDPANGIGNFPMVVYNKLLEQLPKTYKDLYSTEQGKKKHIIEKMLYMVELDTANIKISRRIFGKGANISCGSFLEDKWVKDFKGIDKFDIIMGNPPFQPEKTEQDKRQGGHGGKILWDKFIVKSLELLATNGFLGFITPSSWRKPENKLYTVMTKQNQLLYLHIISKKQGQQLFDVSQRVDLYVIEKKSKYKNTEIIDELGKKINLDLSQWSFLPNYDFNTIKKIITTEDKGIKVIYDTAYHTQKPYIKSKSVEKYKYPIVHSINQTGLVFWYTDDKTKGHFGVPKVLLNFNEQQYPVNDYDGKYGMSQITFGIPITSKKQGDDIIKAINTDAFKEIIRATKWGAFQTDWRMFKYFKPDFYKYFLKDEAASKINNFVTKKLREKKARTKKASKGGRRQTRKHGRGKTTRRQYQ
jgi:hypothetical protein